MLKSMTGFGRVVSTVNERDITVELKGVNHKYLDFNMKLPRNFGFLEERLRKALSPPILRGKVDVYVSIINRGEADKAVSLNVPLAKNYLETLTSLCEVCGLENSISLADVARFSDIFEVEKKEEDQDALWGLIEPVVDACLHDFDAMRVREGERLRADLFEKLSVLEGLLQEIESLAPEATQRYQEKLTQRMQELLGDLPLDEARIVTEVAVFADRVAIDEEVVRLKSHFSQMRTMLDTDGSIGKKIDFLIQEMNRETNTIGSKASDLNITRLVVEIKSELEKMREQVQNIE